VTKLALLARQRENLLVKAGFERRAAESSERDLPPREIVDRWDGENTVYLYADPDGCHCVYAGGTPEYQRYHWLERGIVEPPEAPAQMSLHERVGAAGK